MDRILLLPVLRNHFISVVPVAILQLFTWEELEKKIVGNAEIDLALLQVGFPSFVLACLLGGFYRAYSFRLVLFFVDFFSATHSLPKLQSH
jgi:hypothetical protein